MSKWTNFAFPRLEKVILTQVARCEGIVADPCRMVLQVHYINGELVAEFDPCVDVDRLKRRIALAESLLRHLRKVEALGSADHERIDSFFDPEPL